MGTVDVYIITRRRGPDTAHTQVGRPTYEAPTYSRVHTQAHTNTNKQHSGQRTARPDKVYICTLVHTRALADVQPLCVLYL